MNIIFHVSLPRLARAVYCTGSVLHLFAKDAERARSGDSSTRFVSVVKAGAGGSEPIIWEKLSLG